MATQSQIHANQLNAQKSTGPSTPALESAATSAAGAPFDPAVVAVGDVDVPTAVNAQALGPVQFIRAAPRTAGAVKGGAGPAGGVGAALYAIVADIGHV